VWNSLGSGGECGFECWLDCGSEDLSIWKVCVEDLRRGWLRIYGDRPGEL